MKKLIISAITFVLLANTPLLAGEKSHQEAGHAHEEAGHKESSHKDHADHEGGHKDGGHDDHGDEGGHGGHEEEGGAIKLTPAQIKQAGIKSEIIKLQAESEVVHAPGSVTFNGYRLADVTTLVDGVIHARHVRLGDDVKKGKKLVTLTSSALAQSEAAYLRSEAEHRKSRLDLERVETLVKDNIVSKARLQQAQSGYQAAHANMAAARAALASYGLSRRKIDALVEAEIYGRLTLFAPGSGTIVTDDFRIGQHVNAGTLLLQIADESTVWVEVKLSQSQLAGINIGRLAMVSTKDGNRRYPAKVINIHHQLDQITRTVGVRLEVQNPEDALHPGMFVKAEIEAGSGENMLLLPEAAVQRQGSELIVFVEEKPGIFERRDVRTGKVSMGLVPVLSGVKAGERVVTKGAFTLASELAKSGFDAHNH